VAPQLPPRTLDEMLDAALALCPAEREEYLRQVAAREGETAARDVRELLDYLHEAPSLIESIFTRVRGEADLETPLSFGPYRVVRHLAAGGMGSVYEAIRDEDFQKRVAIKVANTPVASDFWIAQLRRERQILAGLDHPNIAKLLDGGSTAEGLPYLVIEYVEGEPVTAYADRRKLTVRERVELFLKVCAAVSFAHQNLVVHRDLKPGNILVTGAGTPMLLDFGVAKLVTTVDAQKPASETRSSAPFFTPDYCTPEQLTGKAITTRTDVCQLGLLLLHLLTGRSPRVFEASPPPLGELISTVCEQPVPLPSELLKSPDQVHLRREVTGDLDAIVSKATQIDPWLRYDSVDRMVEDLQRWSEGLPVEARPQTRLYRLKKLAARRWRLLAISAVALSVTSIGVAAYVHQSQLARQRFDASRALAGQMLFEQQDRLEKLPGTSAVRDQLATNALSYLNRLSEGGSMPADLREELVRGYSKLAQLRNGELLDVAKAAEAAARGLALAEGLNSAQRDRLNLSLATLYGVRAVTNRGADVDVVLADLERSKSLSTCTPLMQEGCQRFASAVEQIVNYNLRHGRTQMAWRSIESLRQISELPLDQNLGDFLRIMLGAVELQYFGATKQFDEAEFAGIRQFPALRRLAAAKDLSIDRERAICYLWSHWLKAASSNKNKSKSDLAALSEEAWNAHARLLARDPTQARLKQLLAGMTAARAMALERTPSRYKEAAEWYEKAFEMMVANYKSLRGTVQTVMMFDAASEAVGYYLDRSDLPLAAESIALRLADARDLNINVPFTNFPRPQQARRLQALWWLAGRAVHWKVAVEKHQKRVVAEAEATLQGGQADPMTLAVCGYIFDDYGDTQQKARATELWRRVLVVAPDHAWVRRRVEQGASARHPKN
jgi:serine/threonine protein kinase